LQKYLTLHQKEIKLSLQQRLPLFSQQETVFTRNIDKLSSSRQDEMKKKSHKASSECGIEKPEYYGLLARTQQQMDGAF